MQGSDHDIFILRDSSSSASSLSYSRADVLLAAVEMRLLDGPFPLPSSGHDSLCMIDSDTIIMTDSQLGNHLVENSQRTRLRHQSKHVSQLCAQVTAMGWRFESILAYILPVPFHGELSYHSRFVAFELRASIGPLG